MLKTLLIAAALLLPLEGGAAETAPVPDTRPVVRLGIMAFTGPDNYTTYVREDDFVLKHVGDFLKKALPQYRFETSVMLTSDLVKEAQAGKVDLVFGSSGCFAQLLPDGIYPIATVTTNRAPNPNLAVAGAVIVRADRKDLQKVSDLKGKPGIGGREDMYFNYQLLTSAITDRGYDARKFFSRLDKVDFPVNKVLDAVRTGKADGGLIRACVLEGLPEEDRRAFRVLEPVSGSPLHCLHTSRLFPNWTLGAMKQVPSDVAKAAAAALLTSPPQTELGIGWSVANSFSSIDDLYKTLRFGRYAYLDQWTLERFWRAAWPFLMAGLFALLVLIYHFVRVKQLVIRRTKELSDEIERRKQLERENDEVSEKFYRMERVSTMGQLSNMVAHELRQPLAALHARLHTIGMVVKRENLTSPTLGKALAGSLKETDRINAIVDHICSYYRGGRKSVRTDMDAVAREVIQESRQIGLTEFGISYRGEEGAFVRGDPLELKLVVYNLVKNSVEARLSKAIDPRVAITVDKTRDTVILTVSDEASEVTDDALQRIREPQASEKAGGLGLGLPIVRAIIESHAGTIEFSRNTPSGLRATVTLPFSPQE